MEQTEKETVVDSLIRLESYYQSKYEHYLAMATETREHKERVGLLLLDLGRDVEDFEDKSIRSSLSDRRLRNGSALHRRSDPEKVIQKLPQAEPSEAAFGVVDEKKSDPGSISQIKKWTLNLFEAMSVIESVSNLDSSKTLHQNYLHHLLNTELEQELSVELVELYLSEAIRRGYLKPDEFNNNCYIALPKDENGTSANIEQNQNLAKEEATTDRLDRGKSNKFYDLPPSKRLKPTLLLTINQYIASDRPKRFSIDDVVNYLYPQPIQSNWDKTLKHKVRTSISNVLGRKAYLGKYWSRIRPGLYRPYKLKQ